MTPSWATGTRGFRIEAPHFVAGGEYWVETTGDRAIVRRAAPIISYMTSWTERDVERYCARKGWNYNNH